MSLKLTIYGDSRGHRTETIVEPGEYIFGRAETASCRIQHNAVSKEHFSISLAQDGSVFARELGSTHGSSFDGVLIGGKEGAPPGAAVPLHDGSEIELAGGAITIIATIEEDRPHELLARSYTRARTLLAEAANVLDGARSLGREEERINDCIGEIQGILARLLPPGTDAHRAASPEMDEEATAAAGGAQAGRPLTSPVLVAENPAASLDPFLQGMYKRGKIPGLDGYSVSEAIETDKSGSRLRVRHAETGATALLDIMHPGETGTQRHKRFQREGELLAKLDHPGIPRLLASGEMQTPDGDRAWHLTEDFSGTPLLQYIRDQRPDVPARLELLARVCDVVDFVHGRGMVHRRIKPSNLIIREDGSPAVLDFGIAKAGGDERKLTATGQILGNVTFMAPEQLSGRSDDLDGRLDVYALGGVLYMILTGRPPLDLADKRLPRILEMIGSEEPRPISEYSAEYGGALERIVKKALAKDRKRRYATAAEFAADLRRFAAEGNQDDIAAEEKSRIIRGAGMLEPGPSRVREAHAAAREKEKENAARLTTTGVARIDIDLNDVKEIDGYKIREQIFETDLSVIYLALHKVTGTDCVLKVLKPAKMKEEVMQRFYQEGEALSRLNNDGIARLYQVGSFTTPHGECPFLVMKYIAGSTLLEYTQQENPDPARRLDILIRLCDTVDYIHQQGLIHRDLKPTNVMIEASGHPVIIDFGIVRMKGAATLTSPGQIMGTLAYMCPEQVSGESKNLDSRVDVYGLGGIAYTLFTGAAPLDLKGVPLVQALEMIRTVNPAPIGTFERLYQGDLEKIVSKALAKNRDERYSSASELAGDLRMYRARKPIRV